MLKTLHKGVKVISLKDDVYNSVVKLSVTGQYHTFRKFVLLEYS